MSEFKYACPVCGQHIKCDSSQAGTVMDCPTCFQKITVPQAPADEAQKFILTGSKVSDKPAPVRGVDALSSIAPDKKFPGVLVLALILFFIGTTAAAIFWVTIIRPRLKSGKAGLVAAPTTTAPVATTKPKPKEKPAPVAPPANDTNWMLALDTSEIPDTPVVGRVHAQNFIVERALFRNGSLTIQQGTHGMELEAVINFSGAQPEDMSGKTINVTTNADKAAPITLRWKDDSGGKPPKEIYDAGYALRLEFGTLANNRLPGKIYLCLPDPEKSYLLGSFKADAHKLKPKAPPKPQ
jgi:DNA-directed RNA polymerase subunit RPC12/RpoP